MNRFFPLYAPYSPPIAKNRIGGAIQRVENKGLTKAVFPLFPLFPLSLANSQIKKVFSLYLVRWDWWEPYRFLICHPIGGIGGNRGIIGGKPLYRGIIGGKPPPPIRFFQALDIAERLLAESNAPPVETLLELAAALDTLPTPPPGAVHSESWQWVESLEGMNLSELKEERKRKESELAALA